MYVHEAIAGPKPEFYRQLLQMLDGLLTGESDQLANMCNAAALLGCQLPEINWVGFYLHHGEVDDGQLTLGPFHGKPACTRIAVGTGVCGAAAARLQTVIVPDVHAFPGHIACDAASRSEIVVPVFDPAGGLFAVLDVDSPVLARFDAADAAGLEAIAALLTSHIAG